MKHQISNHRFFTGGYRLTCFLILILFSCSLHAQIVLHAQTILHDSSFTKPTLGARLQALQKQMTDEPPPLAGKLPKPGYGFPSIPRNREPLYVMDGVSYKLALVSALPEKKVVRIDVLTPAPSATLFGIEGVNGAVIITTNFTKRERKRFLRRNK